MPDDRKELTEDKPRNQNELLSGNYDGIQEYDNDLPRWWTWLFYLTIIFSVIYPFYIHTGSDRLPEDILASERKARVAKVATSMGTMDSEETLLALLNQSTSLEKGKTVYTTKCAACHGQKGEGLVGPNLTDDGWLHGGSMMDIKRVIENGVMEKGMLAWKAMLPQDDIKAVTAFIYSLHGTNPPNPKAPQGEVYKRPSK